MSIDTARRVVVVGAGPAGARCAERLAKGGLAVTLVGAEPSHPYNRVALSKFLAGDLDEAALTTHPPAQLDAQRITWRPDTTVDAVDREARVAVLHTGERIPYDAVVLATGANPVRLPLPGADRPGVLTYRTLSDVQQMIAHAAEGGDAVVIGGGLLGLEAAAGLARRGMAVTVLHATARLMDRQLDAGAARLLQRRLAGLGIAVVTAGAHRGHRARRGAAGGWHGASPARIVVMAVGIRPHAELAQRCGAGGQPRRARR